MKRRPGSRRIASSMMISFGSIIVAIVFLISLVFFLNAQGSAVSTTLESNEKVLTGAMERVDDLHNIITQISFYVASDPGLHRLLREYPSDPAEQIGYQNQICSFLTQFWLNRPEVVGICVYLDKVQSVSTSSIGVSSTKFARDRGWLDILGNRRGIIINGHGSPLRSSSPIASLSLVTILDHDESLLGYISFEISNRNLYIQCLSANQATSGSFLFAVDENWKIISHVDPSMVNLDARAVYPFFSPNKLLVNMNGEKMIQVIGEPNRVKWRAVEFIPLREVFNGWALAASLAFISVCGLCLALMLLYLMSVRITRPIVVLSSIMKEKNPLQAVLPGPYLTLTDEIGQLYRSYDDMIQKQNQLIDELEKLKEDEKEAELNALRSQMNPHFMYNTLDYISWMAQDSNMPEISRMLTLLSKFLRICLRSSTMKCALKTEVEHTKAYLDIFYARYGYSFHRSISADEDIMEYPVPQFILQPLVENSIIHGFGKDIRDAVIDVQIHRDGTWMLFDVTDNGKGMSEARLRGILEGTEEPSMNGYGLKNVDDRIRSICGPARYSGLSLYPRAKGTCIHFEIQALSKLDQDGDNG